MHRNQHETTPVAGATGRGTRDRMRTWTRQCDLLDRTHAVGPHARWVIDFAIRWAPFGGASASDLMETFGVTPTRFRQLLRESLDPRGSVDRHTAALKQELAEALLGAWTRPV